MIPNKPLSGLKTWFTPPRRAMLVRLVCLIAISVLYLLTLMTDINGCGHEYCVDVGEFQVALAEWGTVHHSGYPLYMLLGSPFVTVLRFLGIAPAAGGSLYSFLWQILALYGVLRIIERLTHHSGLAGSITFALAVTSPIWVHGVIAEVYSMSLCLTVVILWLTLDLREVWSDRKGWILALCCGLGAAHHRLIALIVAPVGLYLLSNAWHSRRFWRWLGGAFVCFILGFAPYLDIPLRVWRGATWVYGQPQTWAGFWALFTGEEVAFLQKPDFTLTGFQATISKILLILRAEIGSSGFILITIGSAIALYKRKSRPTVLFMGAIIMCYLLFALIFNRAVMIEAVLMTQLLCFCIIAALGFGQLPQRWQTSASVLLLLWGSYLAWRHYPAIYTYTHGTGGRDYINQATRMEAPPGSVVMALWGNEYFSLSYAQRIEKQIPGWRIVDHRADFAQLAANADGYIYTSANTLYYFPTEAWQQRLGAPLRITSSGPNWIGITARPLPTAPQVLHYPIGDNIHLIAWEVHPGETQGQTRITLYWTATETSAHNYSTYIHVTNQDELLTAADLIAQSDYAHPVYGWYPTSQWQPREVIREDHLLATHQQPFRTLIIGMYRHTADNGFEHLQPITLVRQNGAWIAAH